MKILIGSKAVGLINNKDYDYLYVDEPRPEKKQEGVDCFEITSEELKTQMNFKSKGKIMMFKNFVFDKAINPNSPFDDYHILDYKQQLYDLIKETIEKNTYGLSGKLTFRGNILKQVYRVAYNIFILKNNSPIITEEQKTIVQKIHDCEMPISYLDELKEIFWSIEI